MDKCVQWVRWSLWTIICQVFISLQLSGTKSNEYKDANKIVQLTNHFRGFVVKVPIDVLFSGWTIQILLIHWKSPGHEGFRIFPNKTFSRVGGGFQIPTMSPRTIPTHLFPFTIRFKCQNTVNNPCTFPSLKYERKILLVHNSPPFPPTHLLPLVKIVEHWSRIFSTLACD